MFCDVTSKKRPRSLGPDELKLLKKAPQVSLPYPYHSLTRQVRSPLAVRDSNSMGPIDAVWQYGDPLAVRILSGNMKPNSFEALSSSWGIYDVQRRSSSMSNNHGNIYILYRLWLLI